MRIGIPRGFYYYRFFNIWPRFFYNLGAESVISPPTNKVILNAGINLAVDEMCLPFKSFLGHVQALKDKCDYVFIPRLVSIEKGCYTCPKVMGLPDVAKFTFPDMALFSPNIDQYRRAEPRRFLEDTSLLLDKPYGKVRQAWHNAMADNAKLEFSQDLLPGDYLGHNSIRSSKNPLGKIALLGHCYNIYDSYLTMSVIDKLRKLHFAVMTSELVPAKDLKRESEALPKKMFWSLGQEQLAAAHYFIKGSQVEGIIYLSCFGCGADSLIAEMILHYAKEAHLPFLLLTVDEHSGEAGQLTRVEAFTDMLLRRKLQSENYFSPHGKPEYSRQGII